MKTNTFLVFGAAVAAAIHSTNAQLIINGSFETPDTPSYTYIYPSQNTLAPWVAGLQNVEVVQGVGNGFVDVPAFEGEQFLDLNGTGRGRLTQAFATAPGSLYTLTFAYANNFYADASTTASATVRVFDGLGDRLNQTITHTGSVGGDLHWTVFTAQFTAFQNTTSLEFTSLSDVDGYSGGIYLDAVQVTLALRAPLGLKIVSPSAYIDREGEGQVGENCCSPFRYQQVFPAEDFAALGNRPHWLVAYTWRPDQSVTNPLSVQLPDQQIRLSTTQRGPNNLSLRFDDNLGSDVIQFYHGRVIAEADAHSGPGPRAFYHTEFPAGVTPFLYDPSQGNLLWDGLSWQGEHPARADMIPGLLTSVYAQPPLATRGDRNAAAIFLFTFIPVAALSHAAWSGDQFQFTLTGETNVDYIIQASTNLQSWTAVVTNSSPSAARNITINAPNSRSFYRAVVGSR